jgi:hypothetical protein
MRRVLGLIAGSLAASAIAVACGGGTSEPLIEGGGNDDAGLTETDPGLGDVDVSVDMGPCATKTTCEKEGKNCGPISDGCGATIDCGTCTSPDTCGGGGVPSVCGHPTCKPKTCADWGAECGPVGDGCGGSVDCGTCTGTDTCGGGGTPSKCGHGSSCSPKTCVGDSVNCGPYSDGCGGSLDCGTCTGTDTCGGGGVASVCGHPACKPLTCASIGPATCGPVADGCGGLLDCGKCSLPKTCGGLTPSQCGVPSTCTGLCLDMVTCPTVGVTTTVSGTVYAPNGIDPLPNVLVYVPNAPVAAFTAGVTCDNCGAPASGSPLVSAISGVDGKFTIKNMPVGSNIPLVIQIGRWRRQVKIPTVAACKNTAIAASLTRLPRNKTEGDIPLMAFSTGAVDALECVMRKIGIDDSEFTSPLGTGRVHIYKGLTDKTSQNATSTIWASGGARASDALVYEDQLWTTLAALKKYDMVLFPCQADQVNRSIRSAAVHKNLVDYANAGGRVFATHFSYIWLDDTAPFSSTATWNVEKHPSPANQTGYIDQTFPKGKLLAQWLQVVGASTTVGQIPLQVIRQDMDGVVAPSQSWMTIKDDPVFPGGVVHYTFNTPVGVPPAAQCGRVLFDDFHVENTSFATGSTATFPSECAAGAMTPQEKLLEFMIFDLGACVSSDKPTCTPKTCTDFGVECGKSGDGCGGILDCGTCVAPASCGCGTPSKCGTPSCSPKTCMDQGIECGPAGDGCGNAIACGACPPGETCGGGGKAGKCGKMTCTPTTCVAQGIECGPAGDGCGKAIDCGTCPPGKTCGGGGVPGKCGAPMCTPKSCIEMGADCGPVADGCGGIIDCGMCAPPNICGGGGVANKCGGTIPK